MQARSKKALLERALIRDVFDFIRTQFQEGEQSVAFGRSAVTDDAFAGSAQVFDRRGQFSFDALHLSRESLEGFEFIQAASLFRSQDLIHDRRYLAFAFTLNGHP